MRGHFSIEWMAQSSQGACGTQSESLPGFYCRSRTENSLEQDGRSSLQPHSFQQSQVQSQSQAVLEAGFSSGTEEETSGYESEGGHSVSAPLTTDCTSSSSSSSSPSSPPSPPASGGRRPRTAFTAEQVSSMERAFKRNAYLGTQDKAELCRKLNLSDKQIRNWFQNRRMKLKRSVQDALAQASVASQLLTYPELQAYRPGPYPRYLPGGAPEGPTAPYIHPHSLQYGPSAPTVPSVPTLPLDSFYQYSSLPAVVLPCSSYQTYPQYY